MVTESIPAHVNCRYTGIRVMPVSDNNCAYRFQILEFVCNYYAYCCRITGKRTDETKHKGTNG